MTRPIPTFLIPYLERVEGVRFTPYLDSGGVPTCGCGHTGDDVVMGEDWTQEEVDAALTADLATAAQRLADAVGADAVSKLSGCQYAALLSFVFNVGADPGWTIFTDVASGDLDLVPAQLMRFVHAGGKVIPGLVNRRLSDCALWRGDAPECPK